MLRPKRPASTDLLQTLSRQEAELKMMTDLEKLLQGCPDTERSKYQEELAGFLDLFRRYLNKGESNIQWNEIADLPGESLMSYDRFIHSEDNQVRDLLKKLIVVKLNGGLGTTIRCSGPKCLIPVRDGLTFLDLTVLQIVNLNTDYETDVPLVIMNSFNTEESTRETIKKYNGLPINIHLFNQDRYPRINSTNFTPLPTSYNDADKRLWYPPGHGNFYKAFCASGLLGAFLEAGKEFCFVSNIDNVAATVDFAILNALVNQSCSSPIDFLMEVTEKTPADIKGGTLINCKGRLKLLEYAQVPIDLIDEFKTAGKFQMFNTNNLWMKLRSIRQVTNENELSLEIIENKKRVDMDTSTLDVTQLETAIGAAIESFSNTIGVVVPRSRFLPVKNTSDLFLLRSNVYESHNGNIFINPLRSFPAAPFVRFSEEHFASYRDLDKRFQKMPDCLDLENLIVSGDVEFGRDITLRGNVAILANQERRIDIPNGSVLQDKLLTGYLNIVDY